MPQSKRLVISEDDLPAHVPTTPPLMAGPHASGNGAGRAPGSLPSIDGVKPVPVGVGMAGSQGTWLSRFLPGNTLANSVIAAAIAALLGWALAKIVDPISADATSDGELVRGSALWVALFGAPFAALYCAWDDIVSGVWESALRSAALGGLVGAVAGAASGALAQVLYTNIIEDIYRDVLRSGEDVSPTDIRLTLARAAAWAIFGVGVGIACAVVKRSSRRLVNALIGGVIGGAVGGFAFNYIGEAIKSEGATQFLGLLIVGVAIGVAIGLIEVARRQAWLKIVGGGMKGKEFIVYHAQTNVGAAPKCEITLIKDPGIAPFHCRIDESSRRRSLTPYESCPVAINGVAVTQHWLRNGDTIQVGSTSLLYQERTAQL